MLLKSKYNEPKPNKMTFKRNKYKTLHLGLKKKKDHLCKHSMEELW